MRRAVLPLAARVGREHWQDDLGSSGACPRGRRTTRCRQRAHSEVRAGSGTSVGTRLAAVEQALELLGRDVNAERELVGDAVEDLEQRMFDLVRAHGASAEQLDLAVKRWRSDPESALESLFGDLDKDTLD